VSSIQVSGIQVSSIQVSSVQVSGIQVSSIQVSSVQVSIYRCVAGTQRVEGVYRNPEVGSAGAAYDVRTKMWSKRNVSVLAEALGELPWLPYY